MQATIDPVWRTDKPSARPPAMSSCIAAGKQAFRRDEAQPSRRPLSACDAGAFPPGPAARVKWKDITGAGKTTTTMTMTGPRWLLLLAVAVLAVTSAGCLREGTASVTGITVEPVNVTAGAVVLNVSTTVQHWSGPGIGAGLLRIEALDDETGLRVHEGMREFDRVGPGSTIVVPYELTLPRRGSYRVRASLAGGGVQTGAGEVTVRSLERLPPDDARTPIALADMDFLVRGVENGRVRIEAEVQLTNQGDGPNPDLVVEIKAREADARLLADRQWTTVGAIRPGATVTRNVTLSVPDQHNYEVEAVLWSGDVIVERGSRSVNLAPNTTVPGGTEFTVRRIDTGEFVTARETGGHVLVPVPTRTPGFGGPAVLLGLALVVLTRRWHHD